MNSSDEFEILYQCADEPIRTPNAIQPFGYLIIFDKNYTICYMSANLIEAFGELFDCALGKKLDLYFKIDDLVLADDENKNFLKLYTSNEKNKLNGILCRVGNLFGLEFEIYNPLHNVFLKKIDNKFKQLLNSKTLEQFTKQVTNYIFQVTYFDRVMLYKFDVNYNGVVIYEAKQDYAKTYLNHHFPADDIPAQARELYLQNKVRIIPDSAYEPVQILPKSKKPLDLTYVSSRSVSPIHCTYLENMNVKASMSFSLIVNNSLWGLVACHAYQPRYISSIIRYRLEQQLNEINLLLDKLTQNEHNKSKEDTEQKAANIINFIKGRKKHLPPNKEVLKKISKLIDCDGIVYMNQNKQISVGIISEANEIDILIDFCDNKPFFASSTMPAYIPNISKNAVGFIFIKISENAKLMCFRQEYIEAINWAGNPEKTVNKQGNIIYFSPRSSFETYKQLEQGRSKPWISCKLEALKKVSKYL